MTRCEVDYSVFYLHSSAGCVCLIVYVDDIILTGSDNHGISQMKHLYDYFQTNDLGKLRYFLGIEVAQSDKDGIVISQRNYAIDILEKTGLVSSKFVDTPMDHNTKLQPNQGEPIFDHEQY